ncbi:MAG: hypothetical protein GXO30_05925 [Epsilonproteobacteria bacterium]|nr:hypothetical protein [Campylobacterota bacterium]
MSSHKSKEHLSKIKDAVVNSKELNEDEKTNTIKHIDEWLLEDKADGIFIEELVKLNSAIKPILAELGLI